MSISVHANPDGTYEVTCGDQSVTVGVASSPAASPTIPTHSGGPAGPFTPPTRTRGGVTARITSTGSPGGNPGAPYFLSIESYAQALSEGGSLRSLGTVRFAPDPGTSIDLAAFAEVARSAGLGSAPTLEILSRKPGSF